MSDSDVEKARILLEEEARRFAQDGSTVAELSVAAHIYVSHCQEARENLRNQLLADRLRIAVEALEAISGAKAGVATIMAQEALKKMALS